MIEEWKPIVGYEGFYDVSNVGRVRSLSRLTQFGSRMKYVHGRILKIKNRINKYPFVILSKENKQESCMIHRLVAEAFIPNTNGLRCVNHRNGNKSDNCVSNLEWCSHSFNSIHALDNGLNKKRKLSYNDVDDIRQSSLSDKCLAQKYNVRKGNIWNIKNYKSWKHV